jgi:hypothetical protein
VVEVRGPQDVLKHVLAPIDPRRYAAIVVHGVPPGEKTKGLGFQQDTPWTTDLQSEGTPGAPLLQDWPAGGRLSSCWQLCPLNPRRRRRSACNGPWSATGPSVFSPSVWTGSSTPWAAAPRAGFPLEVAIHVVRLACECPDRLGRSLSQWDGAELARQPIAEGIVTDSSVATVRRMLAAHHLKPWCPHVWFYPKQPRDAAFYATVSELIDLYTRPLHLDELVMSVDEKTSRQPRPRHTPTWPA